MKIKNTFLETLFKRYLINILHFNVIILIVYTLVDSTSINYFNPESVNLTYKDIFLHNLIFILVFSVPLIGYIYYYITFSYSAILFGLYFSTREFTFENYIHSFLEILAFTIPVMISLKEIKVNKVSKLLLYTSISIMILYVAAVLEAI